MNIEKLKIMWKEEIAKGKKQSKLEFKNYYELCDKLELKVKWGNSKIAQIKELSNYCLLHKNRSRHGYIIKNVYDNKKLININNKHEIYQKHILNIFLTFLLRSSGDKLDYTYEEIALIVGLINDNYIYYKQNKDHLCNICNINKKEVNCFFYYFDLKIKDILQIFIDKLVKHEIMKIDKINKDKFIFCFTYFDLEQLSQFECDIEKTKLKLNKEIIKYLYKAKYTESLINELIKIKA